MYIVLQNYLTGQHSQLILSAPKLIVSNNNITIQLINKMEIVHKMFTSWISWLY
jgi:hypothetical protein